MAPHSSILILENSMDRGAWWATVHGVSELDTTELLTHTHTYTHMRARAHTHTHTHTRLRLCICGKLHPHPGVLTPPCLLSQCLRNDLTINRISCSPANPISKVNLVIVVKKNLPANARDIGGVGSIPGSGRSPGGGNGNPLQYSCLGNPVDREAWRVTVHAVSKS